MPRSLRDRPEFQRGRAGEQRVARWLQKRGWHVIPSYDYAGEDGDKPPRLQGFKVGYPVPDLDVAREGERRWVEVKTKGEPTFTRKTQTWDHGINYSLVEHYQTVEQITGTECWIAVYEESTGFLLFQSLAQLGEPRVGTDRGTRMAYWRRNAFMLLHTFTEEADE